ncbi:PREDICTED: deleted in autism protein 1 homolog [Nicrophorus vespilloides]|uniref:Deleted in autism protein 1 homolog n=1 Tax=Nicrophorus vespilloides TaxID=110193 RepID=A0ABM1NF36_NICVS|nr:PREDICTED: deleted in autism protein 1 homolog [Nicrophorus vespilloides]
MIKVSFSLVVVIVAILIWFIRVDEPISKHTDLEKCPFCYGRGYCKTMDSLRLRFESFGESVNNMFGVKNVLFTKDGVVLKKLGHDKEIDELDAVICTNHGLLRGCDLGSIQSTIDYRKAIRQLLKEFVANIKVCPNPDLFLEHVEYLMDDDADFYQKIWMFLMINPEPIILQLLDGTGKSAVPKYFGACGRLVAVEDAGKPLNDFKDSRWLDRLNLALQLLLAAKSLTEDHPYFRFYLTDVSPDNVAVDDNLNLKIIDLENLIIVNKDESGLKHHHSEVFNFDGFAYSEEEVCSSSISDHNYYAICKLLISKKAEWPMMNGGLLHSIPQEIATAHPELETMIQLCVEPVQNFTRFEVADDLIDLFQDILNQ